MKAFVSHITEETATAQALQRELERALPGVRVFAGDIGLGEMWQTTLSAELSNARATQVLPARQSDIGIVLTHGQDKWDRSRSSPFEFPAALRAALAGRWSFRPIRQQGDLLSGQLHTLTRDQRGGS